MFFSNMLETVTLARNTTFPNYIIQTNDIFQKTITYLIIEMGIYNFRNIMLFNYIHYIFS